MNPHQSYEFHESQFKTATCIKDTYTSKQYISLLNKKILPNMVHYEMVEHDAVGQYMV